MSNSHEGVSCDNCMKSNFSGKRYKCLICYDFDLCSNCYDQSILLSQSSSSSSSSNNNKTTNKTQQSSLSSNKSATTNNNGTTTANPNNTATANLSNNLLANHHNHLSTHAMQCILTKNDYELYFGSGSGSGISEFSEQSSFTCPYCAKFGFSEVTLCDHISSQHINSSTVTSTATTATTTSTTSTNTNNNNTNKSSMLQQEVVCPICAVLPSSSGGDPNHLTENLLQHINLEHINKTSTSCLTGLDENLNNFSSVGGQAGVNATNGSSTTSSSSSTTAAAAAAAALRFSRRLNYSQNVSRTSLHNTNSTNLNRGAGNSSTNTISNGRYTFQFGSGSTGSSLARENTLSSFMRSASGGSAGLDPLSSATSPMDPIAEILSQLTGVRRAVAAASSSGSVSASSSANVQSTNLQLQQIQAHLNRERESLQQQSAVAAVMAAATSSSSSSRHHHLHPHLFGGGGGGAASLSGASLAKSQLHNSFGSSKTGLSNNQTNSSSNQNASAQATQTANNLTNAFTSQILELPTNLFFQPTTPNARDSRYLLSKYDFNIFDNQQYTNGKINPINQSIFINDILLSIITKQLNDMASNNNSNNNNNSTTPTQTTPTAILTTGPSSLTSTGSGLATNITATSTTSVAAAAAAGTSLNEINYLKHDDDILDEIFEQQQQQQQQLPVAFQEMTLVTPR